MQPSSPSTIHLNNINNPKYDKSLQFFALRAVVFRHSGILALRSFPWDIWTISGRSGYNLHGFRFPGIYLSLTLQFRNARSGLYAISDLFAVHDQNWYFWEIGFLWIRIFEHFGAWHYITPWAWVRRPRRWDTVVFAMLLSLSLPWAVSTIARTRGSASESKLWIPERCCHRPPLWIHRRCASESLFLAHLWKNSGNSKENAKAKMVQILFKYRSRSLFF